MILVSACLLGVKCRYDGGSCSHERMLRLLEAGLVLPVCPEQLGGLPTPRTPSEIQGGDGFDVLEGEAKVLDKYGRDVTKEFVRGAREVERLGHLVKADLIVLKEKSPSCGVKQVGDGSFSGRTRPGMGVTAAYLSREGLRIMSDEEFSGGHENGQNC